MSQTGREESRVVQATRAGAPEESRYRPFRRLLINIWKHRMFYVFILPGIVFYFIFSYIPMYGALIAFKDYSYSKGILGSPWAGLKYFREFFSFYQSWNILRNTVLISFLKILFGFPAPIILALMLNEVRHALFKRVVQTVSYLPHFISWVVVVTLMQRMLTPYGGPVNNLLESLGYEKIFFMGNPSYFYQLIIMSDIWKHVGWGSIIYLAAIATIDQEQYEAAVIDGAGRFKQMIYITIPGISGIMAILLILQIGGLMSAGFEQLLLMNNPATASIGTVIDVYVIQAGIREGRFSYSAAVGLFQSVVSLILIFLANRFARKVGAVSLW